MVGLGSAYGDDQVGWMVADELARRALGARVRRARTPADLLGWLESARRLVAVDACRMARARGEFRSWRWHELNAAAVTFVSSHHWDLTSALAMAEQFGLLPPQVAVWGVEIGADPRADEFARPLSADLQEAVLKVSDAIQREIEDA